MSKTKINYNKQKIDLAKMYAKKEIGHMDLIDLLIDAREQRDINKNKLRKCKKANHSLAEKILIAGNHLDRASKKLVLN